MKTLKLVALVCTCTLVCFSFVFYPPKNLFRAFSPRAGREETTTPAINPINTAHSVGISPQVLSGNRSKEWENPGCIERKLSRYRSLDTGRVYHHPSIVHYAKLSGGSGDVALTFRDYTSVLSVYKFLQPERIIFHTYTGMTGKYWDVIRDWKNVRVEIDKIPPVNVIGGKRPFYIQHQADYVKLRALYELGGVTMDFDVIMVNGTQLKQEQKISECVLSEEFQYVNGGFHSCIAKSPFIAKWLDGYHKDYKPELWLHNVSFKPAGILLKDTDVCYNLYLDDTISTHPNWGKRNEWLKNGVSWRYKTATHYFLRIGMVPNDDEHLLQADHSLGQLFRYVHEA